MTWRHHRTRIWTAALVVFCATAMPALGFAATAADYEAAAAGANTAESRAGQARNRWTSTEDTLKAAKKAADAKDFDRATDLANLAKAMADQSLIQAKEQAAAWRDAVIR